jgi:hypothetical protein
MCASQAVHPAMSTLHVNAGYMKHEGKQVKEQTKQKAETATAAARRLLPPGVDEVC